MHGMLHVFREKGQRKKLKSVVQFPEILDMKDFVESNSDTSLIYNLSAVLIHKGARASSGHFVGKSIKSIQFLIYY